jgi:hypothetical protein
MPPTSRAHSPHLREAPAVADLFVGIFRRDLLVFFPQSRFELETTPTDEIAHSSGPDFQLIEHDAQPVGVRLFGQSYRLTPRPGCLFSQRDARLICAIGAVLNLRYENLFHISNNKRMELFRGGSEDHYIAAFVEPHAYLPNSDRASRVASTIHTLRTAALSTYENRRVSTGALLVGMDASKEYDRPVPSDALPYGVELTSLKTVHKLCDGKRTLFLVDQEGRLAEIIDIKRWASDICKCHDSNVPCARVFEAHARATCHSGHVCAVLSPNQEIKVFAEGVEAFSFAHGRWRVLDPASKFAAWQEAVGRPQLARTLFQTALDLAEARQGGLFVVVDRPLEAVGRLIAPHDLVTTESHPVAPQEITPGDPLAKRALHYLARNRNVTELDHSVLEALAGIDGALVTDRNGRLLAFGAILRHDTSSFPGFVPAEGARTTAALIASRFGPVLKVSEDGIISCYIKGARAWDL